ncbi:4434_t:CDS:2, partial [Cetraspora pellucida]
NKTSTQVHEKLQSFVKKFSKENKEETGKETSKWSYFYLINKIFGNCENVCPEFLINSTEKYRKKRKLNDDYLSYLKSVTAISKSKKILAESKKKWNNKCIKIEHKRLKLDKEKFEAQIKVEYEKIELEKYKENKRIELEKFKIELETKTNFELKLKKMKFKLKEMELK